jgi:virginiamycin A acetyltransferase
MTENLSSQASLHPKQVSKWLANGLALSLAGPFALLYRLVQLLSHSDGIFHDFSQFFSLFPGLPGDYLRKGFYYWTLAHCSIYVKISFGTLIAHPQTEIHEGVYIGPYCLIGTAIIGSNATLGSGVHLLSGKHQHNFDRLDLPIQEQGGRFEKISIGSNCWLGNGAIVMANLGSHAIVGAGSVVTSPMEPMSVVGGNPAKVVRRREQPVKEQV